MSGLSERHPGSRVGREDEDRVKTGGGRGGSVRIRNASRLGHAPSGSVVRPISSTPPAAVRTPRPTALGAGGAARPGTPSRSGGGDSGDGHVAHRGRSRSVPLPRMSRSRAWGRSAALYPGGPVPSGYSCNGWCDAGPRVPGSHGWRAGRRHAHPWSPSPARGQRPCALA